MSEMSASEMSSLLSSSKWASEESSVYLREFVHLHSLPRVVRVVKGNYFNSLGVTNASHNNGLHQHVLLVNVGSQQRLLAQNVKFGSHTAGSNNNGQGRQGGSWQTYGPTFSIPEHYSGLFEILSEDGRSVRCSDSIADVARRRPEAIVVRDAVNALSSVKVKPEDQVDNEEENDYDNLNNEELEGSFEERLVREGERLLPLNEVTLTGFTVINSTSSNPNNLPKAPKMNMGKYLRCVDSVGARVYLSLSTRARVSVLAKDSSISGVHRISSLMRNKRLPMMVRLVSNESKPLGVRSSQPCCREYRLLSTLRDVDLIVALPLTPGHSSGPIPVPLEAKIKLQSVANVDELEAMDAFQRLVERTRRVALDLFTTKMAVFDVRDNASKGLIAGANQRAKMRLRRLRDMHNAKNNVKGIDEFGSSKALNEAGARSRDVFDEIEQIYDYIRGMAPLPKSAVHTFDMGNSTNNNVNKVDTAEEAPEPPPLETLPTRQSVNALLGGKKRQRLPTSEVENLRPHFLKQSVSATHLSNRPSTASSSRYYPKLVRPSRLLQPESVPKALTLSRMNLYSPLPVTKEASPPTAPPRYRSLTNLYRSTVVKTGNNGLEENNCGTLESSHSGGHTSFGSGSKRIIPEKRSRTTNDKVLSKTNEMALKHASSKTENSKESNNRPLTFLSRPRSLTSLLWTKTSGLVSSKKENNNVVVVHHYGKHMGVESSNQGRRVGTLYL